MKLLLTNCACPVIIQASVGALAQLGAHNTGSVGVTGSNPVCSTRKKARESVLFFKSQSFARFMEFDSWSMLLFAVSSYRNTYKLREKEYKRGDGSICYTDGIRKD